MSWWEEGTVVSERRKERGGVLTGSPVEILKGRSERRDGGVLPHVDGLVCQCPASTRDALVEKYLLFPFYLR